MCDRIFQALLEEWKQNVALYIDQDKRGLERAKMFLTVQAGLIAFCGFLWCTSSDDVLAAIALVAVGFLGFYLTWITKKLSTRAHSYTLLRKAQCILIENRLRTKLGGGQFRTSNGVITTFAREHVCFRGIHVPPKDEQGREIDDHPVTIEDRRNLIEELTECITYFSNPLTATGRRWGRAHTIGHLDWSEKTYTALYILWGIVIVAGVLRIIPFFAEFLFRRATTEISIITRE